MIQLTEEGDKEKALKIISRTIGISVGIIIMHNSLCFISSGNCGTSLGYLL